jgi:oligopeptidase A
LIWIIQELAKLSTKFSENVLDSTKKYEKLITDKNDISGLPATALGLAAQAAVAKVMAIYVDTKVTCSVI